MALTTKQKWLRTIAWLRRNFPAPYNVSVESREIKEHGYTEFHGGLFICIKINRRKSYNLKIDTLLHEWAHCLTWLGAESEIEDHSAEWGIAYAKLYRTFLEWDYGNA